METKHIKSFLNYAFEFALINFLILGLFELLKPNLVSGLIRLDWYFGVLIVLGSVELFINKTWNHGIIETWKH